MATMTYPYSISLQTLNGSVDEDKLRAEIIAKDTITIALDDVARNGDDIINIIMRAPLPDADKTVLDALVGAHDGEPLPQAPQLVRIQTTTKPDLNLLFHGESFEAELSNDGEAYEQTVFDIPIVETREIHGAAASVWDPARGDRFGLTIVHPVLGTVAELARQVWVPPDGKLYPIVSDQTRTLLPGLILRITYDSLATVTKPLVIVNFIYHRPNPV